MKKIYLLVIALTVLGYHQISAQSSTYRVIDDEGVGNVIFANVAIPKSQENTVTIVDKVNQNSTIYARAYFPKTISSYQLKPDESIIVQVFVDNRAIDRAYVMPKLEWDQMQVYVFNTVDDDFYSLSNAINYLDEGEHTLCIKVGLQVFSHKEKVIRDDGSIVEESIDKIIPISEGKLTIIVE
ncbi:MAG TPA: hypothetical protein PKN32_11005 [Bacteroidales bacterium]|nr:hypothetical protein [Bacteroidales bacterium]